METLSRWATVAAVAGLIGLLAGMPWLQTAQAQPAGPKPEAPHGELTKKQQLDRDSERLH